MTASSGAESTPTVSPSPSAASAESIVAEPVMTAAGEETIAAGKLNYFARARLSRFAMVAGALALAAALGSLAGAVGGAALLRPAAVASTAETSQAALARLSADIAALKAGMETGNKTLNTQFARITERMERVEKAQADPAGKLARISDSLERMERKTVAASAPASASSAEVTGSIAPKGPAQPVVTGWVIHDVFNGRALVESRYGMFEVAAGSNLPGLGRVEGLRRQDGRWVVVTAKGLITSTSVR